MEVLKLIGAILRQVVRVDPVEEVTFRESLEGGGRAHDSDNLQGRTPLAGGVGSLPV